MEFNSIYTKDQIDKLGNAIIFLCEQMGSLSKTKLLKLIYLIEESSIKKYGVPFFNLRFDVWKLGPVSRDLYAEITSELFLLENYITKEAKKDNVFVNAKKPFSDDEFSDLEIELLRQIATSFRQYTADELIELTHRKHSPWYTTAQKNGLLEAFENGLANTSAIEIDMSTLLADDEAKLSVYNGHKEFLEQSRKLKA
ncbi:Panacea domain-containing protein [Pedobacter sp. ASV12]|uniref:Panacea domain-containing protein n=1 Tax=Pedobacter sp. ASV12 TaxID=2795120 RepID=UPI0018EA828E|nr:Panacea domain-containing protein [Pedobacter sp. ASV12]